MDLRRKETASLVACQKIIVVTQPYMANFERILRFGENLEAK